MAGGRAEPDPVFEVYQVPHALEVSEIHDIQQLFVQAAKRSLEAGIEWMEVHSAHGYLLHSFLSPLSNHREDQYGGIFENRIRFLVETVQAVRGVWPERLPLTVRISGTDWVEGGWDVPQSVELAKVLKGEGVDLIDCSSAGNVAHVKLPLEPGYQVHIAEARAQAGGHPDRGGGADHRAKNGRCYYPRGQSGSRAAGARTDAQPQLAHPRGAGTGAAAAGVTAVRQSVLISELKKNC